MNSNLSTVEREEDIFFLVTLDLDRKSPKTRKVPWTHPFCCYVTQGGSRTYKSNFYSEELTVQYLKRKVTRGNSLLPPPSRVLCACRNLQM